MLLVSNIGHQERIKAIAPPRTPNLNFGEIGGACIGADALSFLSPSPINFFSRDFRVQHRRLDDEKKGGRY